MILGRLGMGFCVADHTGVVSLWYPRSLLQFRMAIFFCAATVAGAFSGLLAYGIQFMSGTAGRNGWEWVNLGPERH